MIPQDFRFAEGISALWLLLLIPLALIALKGIQWRLKAYHAFLNISNGLASFRAFKAALFLAGVFFALIALMNPEGNLQPAKSFGNPLQLYILLDASYSMNVKDALGGVSRLDRAKEIADRVIENAEGTAVALELFTDRLIPLIPLTQDRFFVRLALRAIDAREGGYYGTDFTKVMAEFNEQIAQQPFSANRSVVILSDGEDTKLSEEADKGKKQLLNPLKEIPVIAVRIGTHEGGEIPSFTFRGGPVRSKAEDRYLQSLADKRFLIDSPSISEAIVEQIALLKRERENVSSFSNIASRYFQIPLCLSLICFFFAFPKEAPLFAIVIAIGVASELTSFEVWEQDKRSYNRSVEFLKNGDSKNALDLLNSISPQAYAFPIFRSRIAINQAFARLNIGEQNHDSEILQEGLLLLHLYQLLPCEPLSLCSPGLQKRVEEDLQEALSQKGSIKTDRINRLSLIRLAAMMPDQSILDHITRLLPEIKLPSSQAELFRLQLELLRQEKPKEAAQMLKTMAESVFALSFLQLTADPGKEKDLLMQQFDHFVSDLKFIQKQAFFEGKCQCAPWDTVMPMIAESGGMIQQAVLAKGSRESYRYLYAAGSKLLEALFLFRASKEKSVQDDQLRRDLQEMEQLDRQLQAPALMQVMEGKPW